MHGTAPQSSNPKRVIIITIVGISVARSESTPSKPILANIAASVAKTAERANPETRIVFIDNFRYRTLTHVIGLRILTRRNKANMLWGNFIVELGQDKKVI
jgi:hypothetical protein